jgi:peptidoglycan/LPS O-acetylase OafA/YrhL
MSMADSASVAPPQVSEVTDIRRFRPEIHGLRAIAAFLVAVYHVWTGRVSGGVDVFFVVSGFLMTGTLLRQATSPGGISFLSYLMRILRRIVPAAYVVIVAVTVAIPVVLAEPDWSTAYSDVKAAAGYYANWHFASTAVDYNAVEAFRSPVLHFWALSIQAQFYVMWPAVIGVLVLAARATGRSARAVVATGIGVVSVVSFVYASYRTDTAPAAAYFDTFARLWEFGLGGLVAIASLSLRLPRRLSLTFAAAGLGAFLLAGIVVDIGAGSPGIVTLVPTLGATLVLLAGCTTDKGGSGGALGVLSHPVLQRGGDISYSFFLWHFPILVLVERTTQSTDTGVIAGLGVILTSGLAAVATERFVERPFISRRESSRSWHPRPSEVAMVGAVAAIAIATPLMVLPDGTDWRASAAESPEAHPGAAVLWGARSEPLDTVGFIPPVVEARMDRQANKGCRHDSQEPQDDPPITCTFGPQESDLVIALVGGSHAGYWRAPLDVVAEDLDVRFTTYVRHGCRFSLPALDDSSEACTTWNEKVMEELLANPPDAVFTTGTISSIEDGETVPAEYVAAWERLDAAGVRVITVRDTPRLGLDPPTCVDDHGPLDRECTVPAAASTASEDPVVVAGLDPRLVRHIDLNEFVCPAGTCSMVIGNVLVYRDEDHLSDTYARTLAPRLTEALAPIVDDLRS